MIGIGVDIGGTFVKFLVLDQTGAVLRQDKLETDHTQGAQAFVRTIADFTRQIQHDFANQPLAIGIGAPGDVDPERGILRYMPNLKLQGDSPWPLADQLQEATGIRPVIANDATLAAWGVYEKDLHRQGKNILVVTLGTGVGGGLILNGQLYQGSHGTAGEIGHTKIASTATGPLCGCGARGCLEAFVGTIGIRRRIIESIQKCPASILAKLVQAHPDFKLDIAFQAAQQGCPEALQIWRDTGHYLGIGIANIVLLLDIDTVVLTGGVSGAAPYFREALQEVLCTQQVKTPFETLKLQISQTPNIGGIGAAWFALHQLK